MIENGFAWQINWKLNIVKAKIQLHFKMTFFKDERKNDSVYAKEMSFFNDHWNMRSWEISVSQYKSEVDTKKVNWQP